MYDENLKLLRRIGLTEYESKVYLALVSLISSKADIISKESNVPRSKIYSVLESLEKKNLINIREGRPLEYDVIDPSDSLKVVKKNFLTDISSLEKNLVDVYENELPAANTPIISIEDMKKIVQKEQDILKKSKKTLLIRLGFILPSEIDNFKKIIRKLAKSGVQIKILSVKECKINDETIILEDVLSDLPVKVKYVKLPSAQMIIRDYKEMILVFAENSGKSILNANMIGLYNTYSTIISNYSSAFNKKWSSS